MRELKPLCVYHADCVDGFTAAWAVWTRFGGEFDYFAAAYERSPPVEVAGRHVVLVDFCYKPEVMIEIAQAAKSVLVLDHHASAQLAMQAGDLDWCIMAKDFTHWTWEEYIRNAEILVDLKYLPLAPGRKIYCYFDQTRSGAGIAWDFFHRSVRRPTLVNYVEDRDLWKFSMRDTRAFNTALFRVDRTWDNWRDAAANVDPLIKKGYILMEAFDQDLRYMIQNMRYQMQVANHVVWVINVPRLFASDAAGMMAGGTGPFGPVPFAVAYYDTPYGRKYALRSSPNGIDVSTLATAFGGGGHTHAASFTLPIGDPWPAEMPRETV